MKILDRIARRKKRIRAKITGTDIRPRISVYRSSRYIYAQAIDDAARVTLVSFSSIKMRSGKAKTGTKGDNAKEVGTQIGQLLKNKNITQAVFDRGPYAYNGRVKVLADAVREQGIQM